MWREGVVDGEVSEVYWSSTNVGVIPGGEDERIERRNGSESIIYRCITRGTETGRTRKSEERRS